MRILVTGATGFVGRWLVRELQGSGHDVVEAPPSRRLDLASHDAATDLVARSRVDAIAHLAGISFAPDALRAPARVTAVNVGATTLLVDAARRRGPIPMLVTSSADVYGTPDPSDLPLREDAPLRAVSEYGRSKVEQEQAAIAATEGFLPLIITRAFNHTGPGQRRVFVTPALASRVLAARGAEEPTIRVGNMDVRRDLMDVRDVVRAYRLLLEHLVGARPAKPLVFNVASGRSIAIRDLLEVICRTAGVTPKVEVDPALVRPDDPPELVGDAGRLHELTGWTPEIPLERTVEDLVLSLEPPPA